MSKKPKTIEQTYKKLTQLEHVLQRPDTYIGSTELEKQTLYILSDNEQTLEEKEIEYVPGLYKIFDEILVNAADNYQRVDCAKRMDEIRIVIDEEKNLISVKNNGQGIPVQIHQEYNIYVPDLIFGNLLTGSNYDDDQKKVVGGRNGYGAKLANIFSSKFIIECGDGSKNKKSFRMEWQNNMTKKSEPIVESYKGEDYTCVTFIPDLKRFQLARLTKDIVNLLKKRAYDIAGIFNNKVKVYLNNKRIDIKNFKQYIDLYIPDVADEFKIYDKKMTTDRWEVMVSFSDGQFKQVSFVNSICTSKGGTHVNSIIDRIVDAIKEGIQKKNKKIEIKPHMIKSHLWVFCNCLIENPTFNSQTKEYMTLKPQQFGSKLEISESFIKKIVNSGVIDTIINQAKAKENDKLLKTMKGGKKASRITGIPKLEDANNAGTRKSEECTIILTEGDSAKALAMAGIEVVGRDSYGVFPLRGKMLNVRDADAKQIRENQEIQNLIKIIGLKAGQEYQDLKELRYGSVMIMTDQDHDGSHIKGLIINMFQKFWPTLFSYQGFMREFVTPIVKARHKRNNQVFKFFTLTDFKNWLEQQRNPNDWKCKYYKGLGTSDNKEAIEYFEDIEQHQIDFIYQNEEDDAAVDMIFSNKKIEQRKQWLQNYNPEVCVDHNIKQLRYTDFVNKEFIHFSNADNLRSIPSILDGLKPGQRKILFSCFKRNLKEEIKVAQLSGYVSEQSAYHHGEVSLQSTIIGMAQNFMGSNNINFLLPNGQFGTRNMGGKEHASARYLYTNMNRITRKIFPEEDDHCLKYLEDENLIVEPEFYMPIIPTCLVNGTEGIGTGWSTNVPCFNPLDLVKNIKKKLNGESYEKLTPWFRGFQGRIEEENNRLANNGSQQQEIVSRKYKMYGIIQEKTDEDDVLEILELPVGVWTKNFKLILDKLIEDEEIEDLKEYHAQDRIHFYIKVAPNKLKAIKNKLKIKLEKNLSTSNMVGFNRQLQLKRFFTPEEILDYYYDIRLEFYDKRKDYLVSKLQREIEINQNKMKYISLILEDKIRYKNIKKKDLVKQLFDHGLKPMKDIIQIKSTKLKAQQLQTKPKPEANSDEDEEEEENEEEQELYKNLVNPKEYDYLCTMPMWNLTLEKIRKLQELIKNKEHELSSLLATTVESMWIKDLDDFEQTYIEVCEQDELDRLSQGKSKKVKTVKARKAKGPVKRKNKGTVDSSDSEKKSFMDKIKKKKGGTSDTESESGFKKKRGKKGKLEGDTSSDDDDFKVAKNKNVNTTKKMKEETSAKKEPVKKKEIEMTLEERMKAKGQNILDKYKQTSITDFAKSEKPQKKDSNLSKKRIKKFQIGDSDEDDDLFDLVESEPSRTIHKSKSKDNITSGSDQENQLMEKPKRQRTIKKIVESDSDDSFQQASYKISSEPSDQDSSEFEV